jgi:hypothetical protein
MNRVTLSNTGQGINFDRRWAYEVTYFTRYIGTILRDLGNLLNSKDYVEARLLAARMKKRAEYEKTTQSEYKTSDYFSKARKLFNSFLNECINFAELLRVTTIQEETGCEELLDKPEQIQNSIDRLNLLKGMFIDELSLQSWRQ